MAIPIVVEQTFAAPDHALWDAITERDLMVKWYFEQIEHFEPKVGVLSSFTVPVDDREFIHLWQVTDVEAGRRLAYSWQYEGIDGNGLVSWNLAPRGSGSALRFTFEGIETFPRDDPLFTRKAAEQGWQYFIRDRLKTFLDGKM